MKNPILPLAGTVEEVQAFEAAAAPAAVAVPDERAIPKWIDDPHDIEQGQMLNPEWVKVQKAAPTQVTLPEPFAYVEHHKAGDNLWFDHPGGKHSALYTEQQVRALLAGVSVPAIPADAAGHADFEAWWSKAGDGRSKMMAKRAWEEALRSAAPAAYALTQADARDAAFEAVRKEFCRLQRYSFLLDDDGNVRRVPQFSGNWVEFESVHTLFEPASVDAAIEAQAAAKGGGAA